MNIRLIFFSLIICTAYAHAMKRVNINLNTNKKLTITQPSRSKPSRDFPQYALWLPEIQKIVIDYSTTHTTAQKLSEAARTINSLAKTNKELIIVINRAEFTDNLIKILADKFSCSHETIADFLATKQSLYRLNLQRELKELCCLQGQNLLPQLNELIAEGVNLQFTYDHPLSPQTALMIAAKEPTNNKMFDHLLTKIANFHDSDLNDITVLQIATEWPICISYCKKLFTRPEFTINQQNQYGETALLHSIVNRQSNPITNIFIATIEELLKLGADPELPDNDGLTPLDAALELGNEIIIELIQREIQKKHSLY